MRPRFVPLVRDLAGLNRLEYTPYCPICGQCFSSPSELWILECRHYFCSNCLRHLLKEGKTVCPFDGATTTEFSNGEIITDALMFILDWFQFAQRAGGNGEEEVVRRLIDEISRIREELNTENIPCRIFAMGFSCSGLLNCPYDHSLNFYHAKRCPLLNCPNQDCMFRHEEGEESLPKTIIEETPEEDSIILKQNPPASMQVSQPPPQSFPEDDSKSKGASEEVLIPPPKVPPSSAAPEAPVPSGDGRKYWEQGNTPEGTNSPPLDTDSIRIQQLSTQRPVHRCCHLL